MIISANSIENSKNQIQEIIKCLGLTGQTWSKLTKPEKDEEINKLAPEDKKKLETFIDE